MERQRLRVWTLLGCLWSSAGANAAHATIDWHSQAEAFVGAQSIRSPQPGAPESGQLQGMVGADLGVALSDGPSRKASVRVWAPFIKEGNGWTLNRGASALSLLQSLHLEDRQRAVALSSERILFESARAAGDTSLSFFYGSVPGQIASTPGGRLRVGQDRIGGDVLVDDLQSPSWARAGLHLRPLSLSRNGPWSPLLLRLQSAHHLDEGTASTMEIAWQQAGRFRIEPLVGAGLQRFGDDASGALMAGLRLRGYAGRAAHKIVFRVIPAEQGYDPSPMNSLGGYRPVPGRTGSVLADGLYAVRSGPWLLEARAQGRPGWVRLGTIFKARPQTRGWVGSVGLFHEQGGTRVLVDQRVALGSGLHLGTVLHHQGGDAFEVFATLGYGLEKK